MRTLLLSFFLCLFACSSFAQQQYVNYSFKEINWSLSIPAQFHMLSRDSSLRIEKKGRDMIRDATGVNSGNEHTKLFVVRESVTDFMDATIVPFDTVEDGNWYDVNELVRQVLTETFMKQMPTAKIDTTTSTFIKDGRSFLQFYTKITLPNRVVLHMYMFSALINGYDFGCTLMFMDEEKGRSFYEVWDKSRFARQ